MIAWLNSQTVVQLDFEALEYPFGLKQSSKQVHTDAMRSENMSRLCQGYVKAICKLRFKRLLNEVGRVRPAIGRRSIHVLLDFKVPWFSQRLEEVYFRPRDGPSLAIFKAIL